jgi:hypothetical protein
MARITNAEYKYIGNEPDVASVAAITEPTYNISIIKALNWYSKEKDRKDAKQYVLDYAKHVKLEKPSLEKLKRLDDKLLNRGAAWLARMSRNGIALSNDHVLVIDDHIQNLLTSHEEEVVTEIKEEVAPRATIQESMAEKESELIGELEGLLDTYLFEGKDFNLYNYLKGNQIPHAYVKGVISWLEGKIPEIKDALDKIDEQLVEGYSNFTNSKLKKYLATLEGGIADAQKYADFKKVNRKVRVKKAKPAGEQVAKLKYKKEDAEYVLKSIPPSQIIGANQVWIFNTKTKKLAQYVASGPAGIAVKGSRLMNFNPEESKQKTLRKPAETLKKCIDGGKLVLRKLMSELSTKEADVNGRVSEDMIILKVVA